MRKSSLMLITILLLACFEVTYANRSTQFNFGPRQGSDEDNRDRLIEFIAEESSYSRFRILRYFMKAPDGSREDRLHPACNTVHVLNAFSQKDQNLKQLASNLNHYIKLCEKAVFKKRPTDVSLLIDYMLTRYEFLRDPKIHNISISLGDGRQISGVLAIKPELGPRPFVVFQCGVRCDVQDSGIAKQVLMHLYDESSFNVLLVSSLTSERYQRDNNHIAFGGIDEGHILSEIGQYIRSDDFAYAHLVESLHVMGASLGGNGALFTSLFDSVENDASSRTWDSALALCPVVDAKKSIEGIISGDRNRRPYAPLFSWMFRKQIDRVLSTLHTFVPLIPGLPLKSHSPEQLRELLMNNAVEHYIERTAHRPFEREPFAGLRIISKEQFFELHRFSRYTERVKVPTMIYASEDDPVVLFGSNAGQLEFDRSFLSNPHLGLVKMRYGSHCANGLVYGWQQWSQMIRSYIQKHSNMDAPRVSDINILNMVDPAEFDSFRLRRGEVLVDAKWKVRRRMRKVALELTVWEPNDGNGWVLDDHDNSDTICVKPYQDKNECKRFHRYRIRLSELIDSRDHYPRNSTGRRQLTRWINARYLFNPLPGRTDSQHILFKRVDE